MFMASSGPSARGIHLSAREIHIITHLSHARSSSQGLSKRARIILLAWHQKTNTRIHEILKVSKTTVIKWRYRFAQALEAICALLDINCKDAVFRAKIKDILADAPRKGTTPRITGEEKIALVGLACEPLPQPGLPFSHWDNELLAAEAMRRGIVKKISPTGWAVIWPKRA